MKQGGKERGAYSVVRLFPFIELCDAVLVRDVNGREVRLFPFRD